MQRSNRLKEEDRKDKGEGREMAWQPGYNYCGVTQGAVAEPVRTTS